MDQKMKDNKRTLILDSLLLNLLNKKLPKILLKAHLVWIKKVKKILKGQETDLKERSLFRKIQSKHWNYHLENQELHVEISVLEPYLSFIQYT